MNLHHTGQAAATILSAKLDNPTGYGRIIRKPGGSVAAVVEEKAADESQRAIQEINSSVYCFTLEKLWPCLEALRPENFHNELYLTDAIALLNEHNEKVLAQVAPDANEIIGCNTRVELAEVDRFFRRRKAVELMESGVTIYLPDTVLVDPDVEVGRDSLIEPGVQLLGKTRIGAGCTIRTGSVLVDAVLAEGVHVRQHCVIASSVLGPQTIAGPFAHIREGSELKVGRTRGQFRGSEKEHAARRREGHAPDVSGRRHHRAQKQYRRRNDYLQLRRDQQESHDYRRARLYRQRFGTGGAGENR